LNFYRQTINIIVWRRYHRRVNQRIIFDGELGVYSKGIFAFNYSEIFERYEIISLGYRLLFIGINIVLLKLFYAISKSIGSNYEFAWDVVKQCD